MTIQQSLKKLTLSLATVAMMTVIPQAHAVLVISDSNLLDANTIGTSIDLGGLVITAENYVENNVESNYISGFDAVVAADGSYFDKLLFTDNLTTGSYGFQFNIENNTGLGWTAYRFEFWNVDTATNTFTSQISDAAIISLGLVSPAGTSSVEVSPAAVMFNLSSPFSSGFLSGRFDINLALLPVNANSQIGIRQVALLDAVTTIPLTPSALLMLTGLVGVSRFRRQA